MSDFGPDLLHLNPADNVAIALMPLREGHELAIEDIPLAHKVATCDITRGEPIFRYGQIIGVASQDIPRGAHVHSQNLGMIESDVDRPAATAVRSISAPTTQRFFDGYHRDNGGVGTRNYIGIVTSVNCSGSVARLIAEAAKAEGVLDPFPNVHGIAPIVHASGCGMSAQGEGYDTLLRTISGYARHPNFGGVLLVGLGCEVLQVATILENQRITQDGRLRFMTIQQNGGTKRTIKDALKAIKSLAAFANQSERKPAPVSKLVLGLQCGGSDGYSGFTANPALGVASDLLVQHGGISILSETPEIFGAEHLLMERAASQKIRQDLRKKVDWWKVYAERNGAALNNNPSPGNKRGGLTTILEKSLGAVAKSGQSPLSGVYDYAAPIDTQGLVFMDSPGYDPCSVTGQIASGATLIAFTTGRGSVSGYVPSPCLKLASNSDLYHRMQDDMDIDCGTVAQGSSLDQVGQHVFDEIIEVAGGKATKSESLGYGAVEFAPWQIGATL